MKFTNLRRCLSVVIVLNLIMFFPSELFARDQRYEHKFSPGVYYMPKTTMMAHQWEQLSAYNEFKGKDYIKPTLGYYDSSCIKGMEWQIDVASKSGIEWFIFDSYLSQDTGEVWYNESLNSYLASHNKNLLKFSVMYNNPKGLVPNNPELQLKRFEQYVSWSKKLIDKYPEYLRVDGRPLLVLWRPNLLFNGFRERNTDMLRSQNKSIVNSFKDYLEGVLSRYYGKNKAVWPVLASAELPLTTKRLDLYRKIGVNLIIPYNAYINPKDRNKENNGNSNDVSYGQFAQTVENNNHKFLEYGESYGVGIVPCIPSGYSKVVLRKNGGEVVDVSNKEYAFLIRSVLDETVSKTKIPSINNKKMVVLGAWNEWSNGHAIAPGKLGGFTDEYGRLKAVSEVFQGTVFNSNQIPIVPKCDVPHVKKDTLRIDFSEGSGQQFLSWIQKPRWTEKGLEFAFDRRMRLEIPVDIPVKSGNSITLTMAGTIEHVGLGVKSFGGVMRFKMHGKPVWDTYNSRFNISAREGNFSVTIPMDQGDIPAQFKSMEVRSLDMIVDSRRDKSVGDENMDNSVIAIKSLVVNKSNR